MKPFKNIHIVTTSSEYHISWSHSFTELKEQLKPYLEKQRTFLITNKPIHRIYLSIIEDIFPGAILMTIKDGESSKSLKNVEILTDHLLKLGADRKSLLIALGGGVVGDLTGFLAATFMRGIDFIQIPTTLLSMVDSSVGGKTAVNSKIGKNIIGSFYQPKAVFICGSWLETLPQQELLCGLTEAIKSALIQDLDFITFLKENYNAILAGDRKILSMVSFYSVQIKAAIVSEDERELGKRALLNFGHTLAHGLETLGNYKKIKHGLAVAIGIHFAAYLSYKTDNLELKEYESVLSLLNLFGLPTELPRFIGKGKKVTEKLVHAMSKDKKNEGGQIRFILLEKPGKAMLPQPIDKKFLQDTINSFGEI
jgi:3-dehydroquinate synthase